MTFPKWLTGWHQMVCNAITNFVNHNYCALGEDSAQIPSWEIVGSGKAIHPITRGNDKSERTSQGRWGRIQPIPKRTGNLKREVTSDTTHVGFKISAENFAHVVSICVNIFCGARGKGLLKCQGHKSIIVPQPWCWIQSGQTSLLFFLPWPHSQSVLGYSNSYYHTIMVKVGLPE